MQFAAIAACFVVVGAAAEIIVNSTLEEAIEESEIRDGLQGINGLSRRRRYLIYPEGSSMQVVFCLTAGTYIGIADIFYMGGTAALAWQLPSKPWHPKRKKMEEDAMSRIDAPISSPELTNSIDNGYPEQVNLLVNRYTGEPIQPFAKDLIRKHDYLDRYKNGFNHKRPLVNPAMAKRSAPVPKKKKKKKRASVMKADRKAMHELHSKRPHLDTSNQDYYDVEYHRSTRSGLYEKIERLLRGLGSDGRDCVLKSLCEIGQSKNEGQGTFLDEIMRAIFTLHPGERFESMHHRAYDEAYTSKDDCAEKYSKCGSSLKTMPLR